MASWATHPVVALIVGPIMPFNAFFSAVGLIEAIGRPDSLEGLPRCDRAFAGGRVTERNVLSLEHEPAPRRVGAGHRALVADRAGRPAAGHRQ